MTNLKSNKDKVKKKPKTPLWGNQMEDITLYILGVPKIIYRGSLFLPSKRVETSLRTVFAKSVMRGHVNGKLGQMHLDVLEACFSRQLHLTTAEKLVRFVNPDGTEEEKSIPVTGIVFDPYCVRKYLEGRMNNERIFGYIKEIMNTRLQVVFTPPKTNVSIVANTPMIVGFDNYKEIPSVHPNKTRYLKSIYFPPWFLELCKTKPYFDRNVHFSDISDPREQAIKRFLNTHDEGFKINLSNMAICSLLGLEHTRENLSLVSNIRK